MLAVDIFSFLIVCVVIAGSGHILVTSLIKVARYYGLREFVVGFILMAIITSVPELFVGVVSALNGVSSLSFGDIIGANIVDLTLAVGIAALLGKRIKIESELEKRDIFYSSMITVTPLLLFLDNQLSRIDGIILLIIFSLYLVRLITQRAHFRRIVADHVTRKLMKKELLFFLISLAVLLIGANYLVKLATSLSAELTLYPIVIGLTMVSIATTLPEITFNTHSVLKGYSGMAMGDLLGSLVVNSSLILGIVAIIQPIQAYFLSFVISSISLMAVLALFIIFAKTEKEISWGEGIILIMFYTVFVISSLTLG
jgi:cation:H+ antiporter